MTGIVRWLNEKGYGGITGDERYLRFVHVSRLRASSATTLQIWGAMVSAVSYRRRLDGVGVSGPSPE